MFLWVVCGIVRAGCRFILRHVAPGVGDKGGGHANGLIVADKQHDISALPLPVCNAPH